MKFQNVTFALVALMSMTLVGATALAQEPAADTGVDVSGLLPEVVEAVGELPTVVPGPELTLAEAVRLTGEKNRTVEIMRAEVQKAQAQTATAWAAIMPMLDASMEYVRADHEDSMVFDYSAFYDALGITPPEGSNDPIVIRQVNDLSGSISLTLPLINVQGWFSIAAALSGDELSLLSLEQVTEQLKSGTVQAWLAAVMSSSVIEFQRTQVNAAAHHLDFAMKKFNAGSGLRIDVIRAGTDLAKARQELLNAHLAYESARDALALLTGTEGLPMPAAGQTEFSVSPEMLDGAGMGQDRALEQAQNDRYDVRLQKASLRVARDSFTATWGGYVPTLVGGWSGSYQFTEPSSLGSDDRSRWNIFLSLSVPIFQWGKIGQIRQAKMAIDLAELKVDDAEQNVAKDVRDARRQYRTAVANEDISRRQCELAREAYSLVEAAYMAGAGSSLEVTDAQSNLSAAEVGLLTSSLRVQIAAVNLFVALGGKVDELVR